MRKTCCLFLLCLGSLLAVGQSNVRIQITVNDPDSTRVLIVSDAAKVNIKRYYETRPADIEVVDLGLGVLWSSVNYTRKNASGTVINLFPWSQTDFVAQDWGELYGEPWRLPTKADFDLLMDENNCTWEYQPEKGGYLVTSKIEGFTDKHIFLPFTGKKEDNKLENPAVGFYWTADAYSTADSGQGNYLRLYYNDALEEDYRAVLHGDILVAMAIRPVWGDAPVIWSMSVGEPSSIGLYAASIPVTVTIDKPDALGEYGIEYSMDQSSWTAVKAVNGVANLTRLSAATTYYYRGYAKVNGSTNYAEEVPMPSFITASKTLELNDVSAAARAYNAAEVTLTLAGNVLSEVTYGVVYAPKVDWADTSKRKEQRGTQVASGNSFTAKIALSDLEAETAYQYEAYAQCDGVGQKTAGGEFETPRQSKFKTPEIVDLGLSVKWSSFNLGANNVGEVGGLYGWGDPTGTNHSYNEGQYASILVDSTNIAGTEHDIVHAELGGYWRMPTMAELKELTKCKWSNYHQYGNTGIYGYDVTASNGKSIFIPSNGYQVYTQGDEIGTHVSTSLGMYWSSELGQHIKAIYAEIAGGSLKIAYNSKAFGMSIRPVYDDGTAPLTQDEEPDKVAGNAADGSIIPAGAVDLGLSVKWATWNLGATSKQDVYGKYYAWGDDTVERLDYNNDTYNSPVKGIPGSDKTHFPKGYLLPENDTATRLWDPNGTRGWRMPTDTDFEELAMNCDWTWGTHNGTADGVPGYWCTSKVKGFTQNKIFLPACGYLKNAKTNRLHSFAYYWSSSACVVASDIEKRTNYATCLQSSSDELPSPNEIFERYAGLPIRPVKDDLPAVTIKARRAILKPFARSK